MNEKDASAPTGDPEQTTTHHVPPRQRLLHDPAVKFEEYHYYAIRTREEQANLVGPGLAIRSLFSRRTRHDESGAIDPKTDINIADPENRMRISDTEWTNASRAFRTASWGAAFYLITTDVLGPFAVPFAIGSLGYGPGIALFTVFGLASAYSGWLIFSVFQAVDSHEFPARNYGDLAFRTWGKLARYVVNVIQALGLLLLLGQVTILFGQNISSMSKYTICYIVCPLIFVIIGFFLTQIRTLKSYGFVANFGFWLNILAIFISMGSIAHNPPNYKISTLGSVGSGIAPDTIMPDAQGNYPAVVHNAGLPAQALIGSINGLLSGVLAYAGLQLYVEFMAEMKRPRDFLKAMFLAQFIIYVCYIVYGCFVYYYQGQYTFNPSYLGVSDYGWQTAGNTLTLISGLIAAGLYGNIGIKVFYNNVLMDILGAPSMTSRNGKIFYAAIVPVWWSIAFVIAAAIPAYTYFVGIISASTLLNLSYTVPPFLKLGMDIQKNAVRTSHGEGFDPATGRLTRSDGGVKRLVRGFLAGGIFQVSLNVLHALYFLASLSLCGLGLYASIQGMIDAFDDPQVNSFTCTSPLNLS